MNTQFDIEAARNAYSPDALDAALGEIKRLRAIVDRLPKTADGVPVMPGIEIWCSFRDGIVHGVATGAGTTERIEVAYDEPIDLTEGGGVMAEQSSPWSKVCYSTREAAEAARERT